jgi:ribulose-phosphate 3-epimerase
LNRLREENGLGFRIEVDGGISTENAAGLARAGADILVAASSIFGQPDRAAAVRALRQAAEQAQLMRA